MWNIHHVSPGTPKASSPTALFGRWYTGCQVISEKSGIIVLILSFAHLSISMDMSGFFKVSPCAPSLLFVFFVSF
jgi:hypothetical protein